MHEGAGFPTNSDVGKSLFRKNQKKLQKSLFRNDCSGHSPAGHFWLEESAQRVEVSETKTGLKIESRSKEKARIDEGLIFRGA